MSRTPVTEGAAAAANAAEAASGRCPELQPAEMAVVLIPVDLIDVPMTRLRSLKLQQADAIGAAIVADGQYDPITVAPNGERFTLVDGLHRLEGCRLHEIQLIEARIVLGDREAMLRQEALSGVARASHDVFDKAAQIAAMAALAREKAGKPAVGDLRKLNGRPLQDAVSEVASDLDLMSKSMHWSEQAAENFDIGPRQVRRYSLISASYSAENIELLRRKNLAGELGPLLSLAALAPAQLGRALDFISDTEEPTIAAAIAHVVDAAKPTAFNKKLGKFESWFDTLTARERKQVIDAIIARHGNDRRLKALGEGAAS